MAQWGFIAVLILALAGAGHWGLKQHKIAAVQAAAIRAMQEAREVERRQQEDVNNAIARQYWEVARINDTLHGDLERLRNRPSRTVPAAPRPECPAANGAELAREHAEFLVRYSALSAEYDAALTACYSAYDAVTHN